MKSASDENRDRSRPRALWDRLERDIAEAICKVRPTDPQWQRFPELLASSIARVHAEFPDANLSSTELGLVAPKSSPIDDALREMRAMFSVALVQAGLAREALDLLLAWLDFRADARIVQLRIAEKRSEFDPNGITGQP